MLLFVWSFQNLITNIYYYNTNNSRILLGYFGCLFSQKSLNNYRIIYVSVEFILFRNPVQCKARVWDWHQRGWWWLRWWQHCWSRERCNCRWSESWRNLIANPRPPCHCHLSLTSRHKLNRSSNLRSGQDRKVKDVDSWWCERINSLSRRKTAVGNIVTSNSSLAT